MSRDSYLPLPCLGLRHPRSGARCTSPAGPGFVRRAHRERDCESGHQQADSPVLFRVAPGNQSLIPRPMNERRHAWLENCRNRCAGRDRPFRSTLCCQGNAARRCADIPTWHVRSRLCRPGAMHRLPRVKLTSSGWARITIMPWTTPTNRRSWATSTTPNSSTMGSFPLLQKRGPILCLHGRLWRRNGRVRSALYVRRRAVTTIPGSFFRWAAAGTACRLGCRTAALVRLSTRTRMISAE